MMLNKNMQVNVHEFELVIPDGMRLIAVSPEDWGPSYEWEDGRRTDKIKWESSEEGTGQVTQYSIVLQPSTGRIVAGKLEVGDHLVVRVPMTQQQVDQVGDLMHQQVELKNLRVKTFANFKTGKTGCSFVADKIEPKIVPTPKPDSKPE